MLFLSCATNKKATQIQKGNTNTIESSNGRDGLSYENAIIINEKSETKGVGAEYEWIRIHYPDSKVISQALNFDKKIPYDIISIKTAEGIDLKIYFDISNFFGKF